MGMKGMRDGSLGQRSLPEMVELAPAFDGDLTEQKTFLGLAGIGWAEPWTASDTESAHLAWASLVQTLRRQKIPKRPIADILIGAFALRQQGLITRNPGDFQKWFPELAILTP
jgi:hypothetical protein